MRPFQFQPALLAILLPFLISAQDEDTAEANNDRSFGISPIGTIGSGFIKPAYIEGSKSYGRFKNDTPESKKERAKLTRYLIRNASEPTWHYINTSSAEQFWQKDGMLKIMIHGFSPYPKSSRYERVKKSQFFEIGKEYASLRKGYNLIIVDWTELSTYPNTQYYHAVEGATFVGPEIGSFLKELKDRGLITSWDNVHIIGFSLGGQIAGMVGHWIKENTGSTVARITGIDPAGPLFSEDGELPNNKTYVLDPSDAKFVDVIHCNMGKEMKSSNFFQNGRLGTAAQSGHADFYPNGGERQPHCGFREDSSGSCSHNTCPTFFLYSIKRKLLACLCDSWKDYKEGKCSCSEKEGMYLGEQCTTKANGKYFMKLELDERNSNSSRTNTKSVTWFYKKLKRSFSLP